MPCLFCEDVVEASYFDYCRVCREGEDKLNPPELDDKEWLPKVRKVFLGPTYT